MTALVSINEAQNAAMTIRLWQTVEGSLTFAETRV